MWSSTAFVASLKRTFFVFALNTYTRCFPNCVRVIYRHRTEALNFSFVFQITIKNRRLRYTELTLPFVLCGIETWSLTLREERRLRMFENAALNPWFSPYKHRNTVLKQVTFPRRSNWACQSTLPFESSFYLTTMVCYLPPLLRRACARSADEWPRLIR
jgi:hypothetical protein